jgi:hypothetical protein
VTLPAPLTADQVKALLGEGATPSTADITQILRYLVQGQNDLEARARQLKSTVGRIGR